ncbi:glycosyltransferase, YqgM-like family [Geobacter metallireducens GS-15]|uniref:Glycosyltransferase, YqgM-like family n=1 Tax=Geobacter metallireducens (strain ATCC 53774 / DSM 7210 / GS-15) TaxID=269799 RepID=Q39U44_GEOMG|nr:glycosyltransferase, YqgM-like family [Geobacter metallireducens GS-15]
MTVEPLHILHLISTSGLFGAERVLLELASQSRSLGMHVTVAALKNSRNPNTELAEAARGAGLPTLVVPCGGRFDAGVVGILTEEIRKSGTQIIHSHNYKSNYYARQAAELSGARWIVTNHGRRAGFKLFLYALLDAMLVRKADRVVAVSPKIADRLAVLGIGRDGLSVIDNGVDFSRFESLPTKADAGNVLGVAGSSYVIGTVGALTEEKGHRHLLQAVKSVRKSIPNVVCVVVGDGPERRRLEQLAREEGIEQTAIFTGKRDDVPSILPRFDLFVLPSLSEGLPMALLEAQAAKVPAIATNVGAIATVINNGVTGVVVSPGDVPALAEAIIRSHDEADKARCMALKGYERVKVHYSADTMAQRYIEIYRGMIGAGGAIG